jgi:hypothetical protein
MASNDVSNVIDGLGSLSLGNPKPKIVDSAEEDQGKQFISLVEERCSSTDQDIRVAFDCEGVNLSRIGSVEVVSICFSASEVYLIDFGKNKCTQIIKAVKDLFECPTVTKIIHDCRMDCDALYHHHGIEVINVHDTSVFHDFIGYGKMKNLNDTLSFYGITQNDERDKSVYRSNPNFWATRPLTEKMILWASSDVDKLFQLAEKQLNRISDTSKSKAIEKSTDYARFTRSMKVETGLRVRGNIGRFVGRGGENIRSLERSTGCLMYQDRAKSTWFVYYSSVESLDKVKQRMNQNQHTYEYW